MKNPKGPVSGQAPAAAATRRDRRRKSLSDSTDGFWSEENRSATALLNALTLLRSDDFSVRLPLHWTGMAGQAANAFPEIVVSSERKAKELAELRQAAAETNAQLNALNALERGEFSTDAEYFITVCCRDRGKNTLAFSRIAKIIFNAVQAYEQRKLWFVRFMLLMPDHFHGIFDFPLDASMQALFANWKRFLSRKHGIHFQRDFFDHRLRSDESFCQKVDYIRYNPVRAGLVSEPEDWPYVYFHGDRLLAGQG